MMRVLLLQPEDVPERGPWTRQRWDLIVDLGKSSQFSAERWGRQYGCPRFADHSFRHGIADGKKLREIFSVGRGQLVDEEGIDWWELMLPLVTTDGLTALALRAVAQEINPSAELWATRSGGIAAMLAVALGRTVRNFDESRIVRSFAGAARYAGLLRHFSFSQIKEIFLISMTPDTNGVRDLLTPSALRRAGGAAPQRLRERFTDGCSVRANSSGAAFSDGRYSAKRKEVCLAYQHSIAGSRRLCERLQSRNGSRIAGGALDEIAN